MSVRQYVGARYVPKFSDVNGGEWDNTYTYEPLTIVKHGNDYYTSKKEVPTGIAITNTDYWVLTGNYNGAISELHEEIQHISGSILTMGGQISDLSDAVDAVYELTNLKGKSIAIYGDSWVQNPSFNGWIDVIRNATGETVNTAYGGHLDITEDNNISNAITAHPFTADIYLIKAGINDWNKSKYFMNVALGIADIVSKILAINSNAEIYFTTPVSGVYIPENYTDGNVFFPCDAYRQVIWNTCANHEVYVIDGLKIPVDITSDGFHPANAKSINRYGNCILKSIVNRGDSRSFEDEYRIFTNTLTNKKTMYTMKGGRLYVQPFGVTITYDSNGQCIYPLDGFDRVGTLNIPPARAITDTINNTLYYGFNRIVGSNMIAELATKPAGNGAISPNMLELELFPVAFQHGKT